MEITKSYGLVTPEGVTFSVTLTVSADMSHVPAKISGLPEDCHPDESECDITEILIDSVEEWGDDMGVQPSRAEIFDLIDDQIQGYIEEDLWEEYLNDKRNGGYDD